MLEKPLKTWFHEARHIEKILGDPSSSPENQNHEKWRPNNYDSTTKTVSVALVLCLNIGGNNLTNTIKPEPCAKATEAWVDPLMMDPRKIHKLIINNLQQNYELLEPRARYKALMDPTVAQVKKLCLGLRKNSKNNRILFHYNGHGTSIPSDLGEIWVFQEDMKKSQPISIYDLQTWLETPTVYVWDCHSAGKIVKHFKNFAIQRTNDSKSFKNDENPESNSSTTTAVEKKVFDDFTESIHFAACEENQLLPSNPHLPADLFSSCLTTPIQTSILWYILKKTKQQKNKNSNNKFFNISMIHCIPGNLKDRKTILGELNWIFTAITDAIAWNRLPRKMFKKLFRHDLMISGLFRNYLLAEKIMKDYGCNVVSNPELPPMHDHPLWEYWEYIIELSLINLYNREHQPSEAIQINPNDWFRKSALMHSLLVELNTINEDEKILSCNNNNFFINQLKALEIWLKFDHSTIKTQPPDQLPIILQILLTQTHRTQALDLVAKFVDLGFWAIREILEVGFFPLLLKLLQSDSREIQAPLSFIWAKILIFDSKCCEDLLNMDGFIYFIEIIKDPNVAPRFKIASCFVICALLNYHGRKAQEKFFWENLIEICIQLLNQPEIQKCPMLCVWLLIILGKLWNNFDKARWLAIRINGFNEISLYLKNDIPEIRAAAVYALGELMKNKSFNDELATNINGIICDLLISNQCGWDGCVLVRLELVVAIQWFIVDYQKQFSETCLELDKRILNETFINSSDFNMDPSGRLNCRKNIYQQWQLLEKKSILSLFERIWLIALRLSFDPMMQVREIAKKLVDYVILEAEILRDKQTPFSGLHTPKRKLLVSDSPKLLKTLENCDILKPIITTEFVEWNQKIFYQKIYNILYENGKAGDDKLFTTLMPSDWALHTSEGIEQQSEKEIIKLHKKQGTTIEPTNFKINFNDQKKIHCLAFSYLRPYIYICDGRKVEAYNTFNISNPNPENIVKSKLLKPDFEILVNDDPIFVENDPLTEIIIVNEKNYELILMGTQNGLISIWNPNFNEHSHEIIVGKSKMLTANHIFNDQTRIYNCNKFSLKNYPKKKQRRTMFEENNSLSKIKYVNSNHTLYRWNQNAGELLCGGNVKIARIWDAWTEKNKCDMELEQKDGITTSICSDFNNAIVCVGFDSGVSNIYDIRIPSKFSNIRKIKNDTYSKVVGTSFFDETTEPRFAIGYEDGIVKIYDSRQFEKPLEIFNSTTTMELENVNPNNIFQSSNPQTLAMNKMVIQPTNNLVACAMNNGSIRLFDISGIKHKFVDHVFHSRKDLNSKPSTISSMNFHSQRIQLAFATSNNVVGIYNVIN